MSLAAWAAAAVQRQDPEHDEPGRLSRTGPSERIEALEATLGRPLRVLHIGNIANNAYVNAKVMRRFGIEADVMMLDYYHVMGCPEWEEGAVVKLVGTDHRPDWVKTKVEGFERPRWFVQGPKILCARYLAARTGQRELASLFYWKCLVWHLALMGAQSGPRRAVYLAAMGLVRLAQGSRSLLRKTIWFALDRCGMRTRVEAYRRGRAARGGGAGRSTPARPVPGELAYYQSRARTFRNSFAWYDIVQGYALDGILPLLAGKREFACYEHGTLRDIPFHNDRRGRMCAYTYLNAPAVFITNTDCVAAAKRLGIPAERQYPIPHAFDSDRVIAFRQAHAETCFPHNDPVTFMCPTRHHWKHGDATIGLKGNDVAIRAARRLADQGLEFKIIVVRWGQEVAESEQLMAELGVESYFEWIDPVPKDRLWRYYMSCNGVLDQFVIPAIGSVSFETLAFGRPLFTRIDDAVFAEFFGETPPLLNVHTPEALADALAPLIRDPSVYADLEKAAIQWVADRHSSERILEIQLDAYERLLGEAGMADRGPHSQSPYRAAG